MEWREKIFLAESREKLGNARPFMPVRDLHYCTLGREEYHSTSSCYAWLQCLARSIALVLIWTKFKLICVRFHSVRSVLSLYKINFRWETWLIRYLKVIVRTTRLEWRWPFAHSWHKTCRRGRHRFLLQVSNPFSIVSLSFLAPRARKSPRQDDYEVNSYSWSKCHGHSEAIQSDCSLLATKEYLLLTLFFCFDSLPHHLFPVKGQELQRTSSFFANLSLIMKIMKCWGMRYVQPIFIPYWFCVHANCLSTVGIKI